MTALESLDALCNMWPVPCEVAQPIPFKKDDVHQAYDPRVCAAVLADSVAIVAGDRSVSRAVHWQGEPDSFVLGRDGFGVHAIFRPNGAGASEHAGAARSRDARRVFARGEQLRILAGRARTAGHVSLSRFFIATPIRSRRATGSMRLRRRRRNSTAISASSFFRMRRCGSRRTRTGRCSKFLQSTYEAAANCAKWDREGAGSKQGVGSSH